MGGKLLVLYLIYLYNILFLCNKYSILNKFLG